MNARYEVGELVDVLIRNGRIVEADATSVMVEAKDVDAMWLDLSAVTVTRVAPKEWPPQTGDVWETAAGGQWFARTHPDVDGVGLSPTDARSTSDWDAGTILDAHGPMRLAYRRGWSPKPEPAGPPSAERLVPEDPRAATILGLRDMADWLDANPSVPLPYYDAGLTAYVDHDPAIDKAAAIKVLQHASEATGIELDGNMHLELRKTFAGRARYNAILCNWRAPDEPDEDLPGGGGEVAGLVGPATAPAESSPAGPAVPADDPPADAVLGVSRLLDRSGVAADSAPVVTGDGAAVTPEVWVPRRRSGTHYHQHDGLTRYTICGRTARPNGALLPRAEAEAFGAVPCPRCYGGSS